MKYVRLTPYNKQTGALCRRFNVGGCLFKAELWYQLGDEWARKISGLKQTTGAPVFEIATQEQYEEIVRAELAAAYARGGVSLALANPLAAPKAASAPKTRATKGEFDGMAASEVDIGETLVDGEDESEDDGEIDLGEKGEKDVSVEKDAATSPGEDDEIDLGKLRSKKAALELASEYGVALDESLKLSEMKEELARELFD